MLQDTHCHMNIILRNFESDKTFIPFSKEEFAILEEIIQNALTVKVTQIINVGTNRAQSLACYQLTKNFNNCFAAIGIHPNDIENGWQNDLELFQTMIDNDLEKKIVAIGECGIDKHYPNYNLELQKEVFRKQIELALKNNLAIIVHSRDADEETYSILYEYKDEKNFRGVIHCFSSDRNYAQKYIDLGFVLGFGGTVTYPKNEELRFVATSIDTRSIILETDAPFLSPQSIRGTKNVPANIAIIAQYIAQLKNENYNEFCKTISDNVERVFGIKIDTNR